MYKSVHSMFICNNKTMEIKHTPTELIDYNIFIQWNTLQKLNFATYNSMGGFYNTDCWMKKPDSKSVSYH